MHCVKVCIDGEMVNGDNCFPCRQENCLKCTISTDDDHPSLCIECFPGTTCDLDCSMNEVNMIHDYEHGKCVDDCTDPNSFIRWDHPQAGFNVPRCDYCESFYCEECGLIKNREMYPEEVYMKKCNVCSNDVEGNQLWAIGEDCTTDCPDGFYEDEYECMRCGWGCEVCSEEDVCDQCQKGYILTDDGHCVNECPKENYYKNPETDMCDKCPEGCTRCRFDYINKRPYCHDCDSTHKLTPNHMCVTECHMAGFVDQLGEDGIHYCQHECDYKWGRNNGVGEKDVCF